MRRELWGIDDEEKIKEFWEKYLKINLKAAQLGYTNAMREVADMYLYGEVITKNTDEAIKYFQMALDKGDISAAVNLGSIYFKKDIEKSIHFFSIAANQNNIEAIKELVEIYEKLNNFEKVFEWCQKGDNLGNRDLTKRLAECYLKGQGVQQDDFKALDLYIKLVEKFYDSGDLKLVTKLYNKHFNFTDEKILKYYRTTEKVGKFNAMFGIAAELYKTDKYRALKWYKLAEQAGDYDAAVAVHYISENEILSKFPNISGKYYEAIKWYKKATEFGDINAIKNLVMICDDYEKSLEWLEKVIDMEGGNKYV